MRISRQPVYFKQNLTPKKMRGHPMTMKVHATGDVWDEVRDALSKAHEKKQRRLAVNVAYAALVFPFALWIMLGLGVVHSHFSVVPALGYWETVLVTLAVQSVALSVNAGRNDA